MFSMLSHPLTVAFSRVGFNHLLTQSGVSDKVREWLGREPERLAFQVALAGAYNTFAGKHPQWAATLFDEHFLKNSAAPLLLRCLPPADPPDPAELAGAWAGQMSGNKGRQERCIAEVTPIASEFLREFEKQLRARPEFQALFDSRGIGTIAEASTKTAESVEGLRAELREVLGALSAERKQLIKEIGDALNDLNATLQRALANNATPADQSALRLAHKLELIQISASGDGSVAVGQMSHSLIITGGQNIIISDLNDLNVETIRRVIPVAPDQIASLPWPIIDQHSPDPPPVPDRDWLDTVSPPIGAISGPFYVARDADAHFKRLILQNAPPIIIRGARQTGKTSLLAQGIIHAREHNLKVVHLDLQAVGQTHLQAYDHFLRYLAESIVSELGLDRWDPDLVQKAWSSPRRSAPDKLSRLLSRDILPKSDKPIVLALDEADYLLEFDFRADFFGLLRSWHNRAATDRRWRKLNMVLVISTEPHLLIADPYQSPFNVGKYIDLKDFSKEQLRDLAQTYRLPLQESEMGQLMALLNGHPYLTHQALYTLATESCSWAELADLAMSDDGPFASHLRRYYALLRTQSDLQAALKQVIHKQSCPKEAFHRLKRAGLLVRGRDKQATFRCHLYQKYFEETL
ncbi:MAG: AAA-like domain-containing protein [Ardenticatenaceae bacterium]